MNGMLEREAFLLKMELLLLIILSLSLMAVIILKKQRGKRKPSTSPPPGPRGLPLIGNLHQIDSSKFNIQLDKLTKTYGPLFSLQLGFKQAIVVSSPKLAKEILKDHDIDVCTRPPSLGPLKLTYNGQGMLFSPFNDYWRKIRKICMVHFFSSKRISSFSSVRKSEVKQMMDILSGHVRSSKVTNLSELLMSVSSGIICRVAFGRKYDEEGAERSRFHGLLNDSQAMLLSFFVSDYIPFLGWIDKLTGLFGRLENTFKALDVFFQEVIDDDLNSNRIKQNEDEDIVNVLLELKKQVASQ